MSKIDWEIVKDVNIGGYLSPKHIYEKSLDDGKTWSSCDLDIYISGVVYRRKPKTEYVRGSYKEFFYVNDETIYGFFEDYRFLSNFHLCEFEYKGKMWKSSEHAYMWSKAPDIVSEVAYQEVKDMTPAKVKRWGSEVALRRGWADKKYSVMFDILVCKFSQNSELLKKLLDTGDKTIVEANNWHDSYWGYCVKTNKGQNNLGEILMDIRSHFRFEKLLNHTL